MTSEQASTVIAYVGLGSNLQDPRGQLRQALAALAGLPGIRVCFRSSLYATPAVGPVAQPDFVNAVVSLATHLGPLQLLAALQGIERDQGRVRDGTRWGPRTLDLDLLLFGESQLALPGLTVPHPEIARRAFVLVPLAEIAPAGLMIPGQGHLATLLADLPDRDQVRPLPPGPDGSGGPHPLDRSVP